MTIKKVSAQEAIDFIQSEHKKIHTILNDIIDRIEVLEKPQGKKKLVNQTSEGLD